MRRLVVSSGLVLALCVPLAACGGDNSGTVVDTKAISQSIDQDSTQLLDDFRSKDGNRIASHYAEDATLMISGNPPSEGRTAIARNMAGLAKDPAFAIDFGNKKTIVAGSGDIAYAVGNYNVSYTDPAAKKVVSETGRYLTVYRKQSDGSWKIQEDITSSSGPPTAAAGAAPAGAAAPQPKA